MSASLISIIVPCYNQAQYLDECLQSVLDQTYEEWECLIINDGSPDDTEEVAMKWAEKDSRFIYFKKENGGVASARNFGIEKAKGKWILPLDGDDKIGQEYLSLAFQKTAEGYDLVYCKGNYFGLKNTEITFPDYTYETLLKYNVIFCSALFNKEKMNGSSYDEKLVYGMEDWEFWISYLQPSMKVCRLEQTLFYYRIKKASRNEEVNNDTSKMDQARAFIFLKHQKIYLDTFGDYFFLIGKISALERENARYEKIFNSKKYQLFDKIISVFNKIKP